jgi:hypothetical protein
MATMHSIEVAESDGSAAYVGRQVPPVVEDADHDRDGTWT